MAATQLPAIGSTVCNNHVDGADDHNLPSIVQRNDASTGYEVGDYDDFVSMANIVFSAMRLQAIAGSRCTFVGSTAASFTFNTPEGRVEIGDTVEVFHSQLVGGYRHSWWVTATVKDQVTIDAASIRNPTGALSTMTYNADISVGDLIAVRTLGSAVYAPNQIGVEQLITDTDAASAVTAAGIYFSVGQTVGAELTDHSTRMNMSLDAAGVVKDGAIANATIAQDTLTDEGFNPKVYGEFEEWSAGPFYPPVGVIAKGGATVLRSTDSETGNYSIRVTTTGIGQGIELVIEGGDKNIGKNLISTAKVKLVSGAGEIRLVHYDVTGAASFGTGANHTLTSAWTETETTPPDTVPAGSSLQHLQIETISGSPVFLIDASTCHQGNLEKAASPLVNLDYRPQNLGINDGFSRRNNGLTALPDGWEQEGTGVLGLAAGDSCDNALSAGVKFTSAMGGSNGIKQNIGAIPTILSYLKGKTVTWSFVFQGGGGGRAIHFEIDDGITTPTKISLDTSFYTAGEQVWLTHAVSATATEVTRKAYYAAAVAGDCCIYDGCFNIGSAPAPWTGEHPSIWTPHRLTFALAGSVTPSATPWLTPRMAMPAVLYPLAMRVYSVASAREGGFPTPVVATHKLRKLDGSIWSDTGLKIDYTTTSGIVADQQLRTALTDLADVESAKIDYHEVAGFALSASGTLTSNPSDVTVVVDCYSLAL